MSALTAPINLTNNLKPFLECKDYTVSNELFTLLLDTESDLLITSPQPNLEDLPKYYKSEAYISHTDSKKGIFDKIYQFVKSYTIKKKVKLINTTTDSKEKSLLDIGCGTGDFLIACKKENWQVVGIEPNEKAKEFTKSKLLKINSEKIKLIQVKMIQKK